MASRLSNYKSIHVSKGQGRCAVCSESRPTVELSVDQTPGGAVEVADGFLRLAAREEAARLSVPTEVRERVPRAVVAEGGGAGQAVMIVDAVHYND